MTEFTDKVKQHHEALKELTKLKIRFDDHLDNYRTEKKDINEKLDKLDLDVDARVKFSTFTWVLGILMVIVIGLLGLIYSKTEAIDTKTNNTSNEISVIKGILTGAEITK